MRSPKHARDAIGAVGSDPGGEHFRGTTGHDGPAVGRAGAPGTVLRGKPRRGGVPKGLHPLKGLVAPSLAATGVLDRDDLLDLFEPQSWCHPLARNFQELRGPAVIALAAGCGATLAELPRIRRQDWMPHDGSERLEQVALPGQSHRKPRTVPVIEMVAMVVDRYDRAVERAPGVDHLFVDHEGQPATAQGIFAQCRWFAKAGGIPIASLVTASVKAFERWCLEADPDSPVARALVGRGGRQWLLPASDVSLLEMHRKLESVHPLGRLDRGMLRWKGAHARRFLCPHFPALSREDRTEFEHAKKIAGGTRYGEGLRRAVLEALGSGKSFTDVARHYGVNVSHVQDIRDGKVTEAKPTLASRQVQVALAARFRTAPPPDVNEARRWLWTELGVKASWRSVYVFARNNGLEAAPSPRFWLRGHRDALLERMTSEPPPSAAEVRAWGAAVLGIDLDFGQIGRVAVAYGISLARDMDGRGLRAEEAALVERAKAIPDATAAQHAAWLRTEWKIDMTERAVAALLTSCGWLKPKKSIFNGHVRAVRDLVAAHPDLTYREIVAWLAERGVVATDVGVNYALRKMGIVKRSQRGLRSGRH